MSFLKKYLKGWQFRSTTPTFEPGQTVNVFVARYDEREGVGIARIGDTILAVEGAEPAHVELQVRVRVTEFDAETAEGRGEFLEVVGESSYAG
ncbi:DUF7513 family protein [Natrononativus amylolyticus]|uniref:DUF7513 family protein n=1 Tax=Natrononativus amylolyticus TaxID=2963434 RepID=UPI0020CFB61B|nr:TRAM domain-containing protein [Natrononativus amylolyticus]